MRRRQLRTFLTSLVGFGVGFRARLEDSAATSVTEALRHCLTAGESHGEPEFSLAVRRGERGYEAQVHDEAFVADSLDQLLPALVNHVEKVIAEHSSTHVFLHAGVVSLGDTLLVLPGASLAGKSTAVAALVAAGATYWSDEFAPVAPDGRVAPFARPLNRRVGATTEAVPLEGPTAPGPVAVDRVILARYEAGRRWEPVELSRGEALLHLIEHTVPARQRPAEAMDALDRLLAGARVEAGWRGEADEFAQAIMARV